MAKYDLGRPVKRKPELKLNDALHKLEIYIDDRHFSKTNKQVIMTSAKCLMIKYGFTTPTLDTARRIEADLKSKNRSPNTIRNRLGDIEYIMKSQGNDIKVPKPRAIKREIEYLCSDECRRLLDAAQNLRDSAVLSLLCYAGPRAEEVINIWVEDHNPSNRSILIRDHGQGIKSGRERKLELTKECNEAIVEWKKQRPRVECPNLFITAYGKPLTKRRLLTIVKNTAKRAKIEKRVGTHLLRHSFCSNALIHGVPLTAVAKQAGHRSLASTYRYLHASQDLLKANIGKLHY